MFDSIAARDGAKPATFFSVSSSRHLRRLCALAHIALAFALAPQAYAQVPLNSIGTAYTQNFDTLWSGTATNNISWTDNSTLPGWYYKKGAAVGTTYSSGTGSSNTGSLWSFGVAGADVVTNRSLGTLASSSNTYYFAVRLANHTGSTISALNIRFTGKQWRTGSTGAPQKLQFQYQVADAGTINDANGGTAWTAYTPLDFTTPNNSTGNVAVDGNAAANRTALGSTLSNISVADGQEIWLRWMDLDDAGSDAALAIDDLSITPYADSTLFINDSTCTEGDSGTTNCAFDVSLSTPVDNDVSFDIATQDIGCGAGCAVAGTDYTATTTHVTIPAGSTSYTFNVPVIGNTSIQPNRLFNVAIGGISGAVAGNLVGVGTIVDDDTPSLSINDVAQIEGDSGTTPFVFTVTLSKTPGSDVAVKYATRSGTASAPSDYTAVPSTTMTFLAGTSTLTQTITVNVNGDTAIENDETFFVDLSSPTNAVISTVTGTGTILNDDATANSIMAIQGQGTGSSFAGAGGTPGKLVSTPDPATSHLNIVTATKSNGFYMQDNSGDNDITTSDGIFVFTGSAPNVSIGDAVIVRGRVQEFRGSTQIAGIAGQPVSVIVASSGNALPAAYDLTANAPSHDPASGICANAAITDSSGYQARNFACLDGMLVKVTNGLAVTPTSGSLSYSTTPVSDGVHPNNVTSFYATADGTRPLRSAGLNWPGDSSRPDIPVYKSAPEAFQIYYGGLGFDPADFIYNAGTTFKATGILTGYSSSTTGGIATTYELYPLPAAHPNAPGMTTASTPAYPVAAATPTPGELTIATQNGLHFFNDVNDGSNDSSQYTDKCLAPGGSAAGDNDQCPTTAEYQVRLEKMSRQIRLTLKAPIVQVIQEVENYNTLAALADRIHADDPTLTYVPYSIRGNDPGGINIGILVRDNVTVNSVTQFYRDTQVNDACNPSFPKPCLLNDRPPVLLDATYQGYRFRVLAIYHRSLGSLAKTGYVGQKRMEQAVQVAGLINRLQHTGQSAVGNTQQMGGVSTDGSYTVAGDDNIPLVVLGDFNAYEFNDGYVDVTGLIMGTAAASSCPSYYCPSQAMDIGTYTAPNPVMFDTGTVADPNNGSTGPYSYTFNAFAQEIDHIVISDRAHQDFVRISHAHGNADATDSAIASNSYGSLVLDPTTAMRTSDHDGQVVTLGIAVNASAGSGGSVNVAGQSTASATLSSGGSTSFTFIADNGHHFDVASDTCGAGASFNANTGVYSVNNATQACTVNVTFAADAVAGICGSASGGTFASLTAASPNLCGAGTVINFAGNGPWSWTCHGANGGTDSATCTANAAAGRIGVFGGANPIVNGDNSPTLAKGTDFGSVNVGAQSAHGFTINNAGAAPQIGSMRIKLANGLAAPSAVGDLTINSITSSNAAFAVAGGIGTIASGGSATFTVTFHPTAAGVQNGTITINSTDATTPAYTFAVTGLAVAVAQGTAVPAPVLAAKSMLLLAGLLAALGHLALRRRKSMK